MKKHKIKWPKGDDREFYKEEDIPKELMQEIRNDISEKDWDYFIKTESAVIKRNQTLDIRDLNNVVLNDNGWGIFLIIK
jgi:hypothetical protein